MHILSTWFFLFSGCVHFYFLKNLQDVCTGQFSHGAERRGKIGTFYVSGIWNAPCGESQTLYAHSNRDGGSAQLLSVAMDVGVCISSIVIAVHK